MDWGLRIGDFGLGIADCGLRIADWGLGIADWGLGIADWGLRIGDCDHVRTAIGLYKSGRSTAHLTTNRHLSTTVDRQPT